MTQIVPFRPEHLAALELQEAQAYMRPVLAQAENVAALIADGYAFTSIVNGRVTGCAGILATGPTTAQAWALIGEGPSSSWINGSIKVLQALEAAHRQGYRCITALVETNHEAGHRWARWLGFEALFTGVTLAAAPPGLEFVVYGRTGPIAEMEEAA